MYYINDAQRDKITFIIAKGKPEIDVNDSTADESLAEMWDIEIAYNGKILLPISTSEGLMFIDRTYLSPFADMPFGMWNIKSISGYFARMKVVH